MVETKVQKIIFLSGTTPELEKKFESFAKSHEVIDWQVDQNSHSITYHLIVRYWQILYGGKPKSTEGARPI